MAGEAGPAVPGEFSLFVGDLAHEVDDAYLHQSFAAYYPSVRSARVMTDAATGRSRGYGFVRFGSEQERDKSLQEMNGATILGRQIRCSAATPKRTPDPIPSMHMAGGGAPHSGPPAAVLARLGPTGPPSAEPSPADWDPTNTTLFIGGLSPSVNEDLLRATFGRYGSIIYAKVPPGKGCGFVQFVERRGAEWALLELQGQLLGGSAMRISWGKSQGGKGDARGPTHAGPVPYGPVYTSPYGAVAYAPYDPYHGGPAYSAVAYPDVYGYAAVHPGMDPYGYAYGGVAVGGYTSAGGSSASASSHGGAQATLVYDPMQPMQVDKVNAMYMQRRLPIVTGAFMRPVQM